MTINNIEHLSAFKNVKGIEDIINEIKELEYYQNSKDFSKAFNFLNELSIKYCEDKIVYNALHPYPAKSIEENLNNAKQFLYYKAERLIINESLGARNHYEKQ